MVAGLERGQQFFGGLVFGSKDAGETSLMGAVAITAIHALVIPTVAFLTAPGIVAGAFVGGLRCPQRLIFGHICRAGGRNPVIVQAPALSDGAGSRQGLGKGQQVNIILVRKTEIHERGHVRHTGLSKTRLVDEFPRVVTRNRAVIFGAGFIREVKHESFGAMTFCAVLAVDRFAVGRIAADSRFVRDECGRVEHVSAQEERDIGQSLIIHISGEIVVRIG